MRFRHFVTDKIPPGAPLFTWFNDNNKIDSNHMSSEVCDKTTYPFPKFYDGCNYLSMLGLRWLFILEPVLYTNIPRWYRWFIIRDNYIQCIAFAPKIRDLNYILRSKNNLLLCFAFCSTHMIYVVLSCFDFEVLIYRNRSVTCHSVQYAKLCLKVWVVVFM